MNREELISWIENDLPGYKGWWSTGYETFIECADKMINAGMEIEDVKDTLESLHGAVSAEYGN